MEMSLSLLKIINVWTNFGAYQKHWANAKTTSVATLIIYNYSSEQERLMCCNHNTA